MESLLVAAFQAGLSADNEKLRQANQYLDTIRSEGNVIQTCAQIALSHESMDTRLVSVIYLKNLTKFWKDSKRDFFLPSQDKAFLKSNILNFLVFSIPDKIRAQFQEIAFNIAKSDFLWEEILSQIDTFLMSTNPDQIFAALVMISQIAKVFEHKINDRRDNMKILVCRYFKRLCQLLKTLMNESEDTRFKYAALILQIYWTCFYIELPEEQATIENLQDWLSLCRNILSLDVTGLTTTVDTQMLEDHPKWQCKKWTAQILHRFFNRYFNTLYLKNHHKFIGEYFQTHWAVPLSQEILLLLLSGQGNWVPNTFNNYLLKFLVQAFRLKITAESLAPYSEKIIVELALPMMRRTQGDEEMWKSDPIEFIRKETDIGKAYYSASNSAAELLKAICEQNKLEFFMKYLESSLETGNLIVKESFLHALGVLNKLIRVQKVFGARVESILVRFALPEFNSPVGFLRSRACWVYSCYSDLKFEDLVHQDSVLGSICALMVDSELPVRIEAATTLPKILDWPGAKIKIASEIQMVLQIYLDLMNLIDYEELIESLEDIVGNFSTEITPFALDLSTCLVSSFLSMSSKEDSDSSIVAAESILNTLGKLIDTLEDSPSVLANISLELHPIFDFVFTQSTLNYFDATLSILTSLLYYCPHNSLPNLFKYTSSLYNFIILNGKVKDFVKDNIGDIFSVFANYLKKYKTQSQDCISLFTSFATILVTDGYIQLPIGCKIFMAIVENCSLDSQLITQVLINSYPVFTSTESKKVKILFVQILMISCWRAPVLTLEYMQKLACVQSVFGFVIENHMMFKEDLQILQGLLGLCALIVAAEQVGALVVYVPALVGVVVKLWNRVQGRGRFDEDFVTGKVDEEDFDEDGKEMYESVFEEIDVRAAVRTYFIRAQGFLAEIGLLEEDRQAIALIMQ